VPAEKILVPTAYLRFIERKVAATMSEGIAQHARKIKVFQQWWTLHENLVHQAPGVEHGEWKDVPLEME
jgi:hypothetical protein